MKLCSLGSLVSDASTEQATLVVEAKPEELRALASLLGLQVHVLTPTGDWPDTRGQRGRR